MINIAEVRHQHCHQLEAKPQTMIFHLLHMIAGHIHDGIDGIEGIEGNPKWKYDDNDDDSYDDNDNKICG